MGKLGLTLALVFSLASGASANLIANGSFETPAFPAGTNYEYIPGGSTTISGWDTVHTGVERINLSTYGGGVGYGFAHDGAVSLDLNTDHGVGGGIQQAISTAVGAEYLLTFYQGTYVDHGRDGNSNIVASAGSSSQTFSYTNSAPTISWTAQTLIFTATAPTTLVSFTNFDSPSQNFSHIDSVSVSLVPEPTTALLLGIGLASLAARREK